MMNLQGKNRIAGFTLLELMVTVAVAAIVTTVAVPAFTEFVRNNRMVAQANDFITDLNLARSEAIRRGRTVALCRSTNGTSCTTDTGGWEGGWIVVADPDGTPVRITAHGPLENSYSLVGSAAVANRVNFGADGAHPTSATIVDVFALCHKNDMSLNGRAILLGKTGHVKMASRNASGQQQNDAGTAITSCTAP